MTAFGAIRPDWLGGRSSQVAPKPSFKGSNRTTGPGTVEASPDDSLEELEKFRD